MTRPTRAFVQRQLLQALIWGGFMALMLQLGRGNGSPTSGVVAIALVVGFGLWGCNELLRHLALSRAWLEGSGIALAGKTVLAVLLLPVIPQVVLYLILHFGVRPGWLSVPGGIVNYSPAATLLYWMNSVMPLGLWAGV